jgi:ribonuclease VapC
MTYPRILSEGLLRRIQKPAYVSTRTAASSFLLLFARRLASALNAAASSALNLAEVHGKPVDRGLSSDEAWEATRSPIREAVSFTPEHVRLAGDLVRPTRLYGLSLGDRACLALGIALKAPVYTADRSWKNLRNGIRIHVIR